MFYPHLLTDRFSLAVPRPEEVKVALRIGGKRFSASLARLENLHADSRSLPVTSGCGRLTGDRQRQEWPPDALFLSLFHYGYATATIHHRQECHACDSSTSTSTILILPSTLIRSAQMDDRRTDSIVRSHGLHLSSSGVPQKVRQVRLSNRGLEIVQAQVRKVANDARAFLRRTDPGFGLTDGVPTSSPR